ncbi:hypothetical protein Leryth_019259 [Lithospermum erythrorhizon]|nr:hypothetical protein Leryth_019259 [Lithospermum erythrorhizon]
MLPMFLTFICLGVGKTYFVVQADSMNPKIGKWKVPLQVFQLIYDMSTKKIFNGMALKLKNFLKRLGLNKYAPPVTITMAIIFSVLRYVNAAKVESRRLHVIRTHNLLDKPDERIPMSMFWLVPQYMLLAGVDSFIISSVIHTLNQSRQDNYYWTLASLSGVCFVLLVLSVIVYPYKTMPDEPESEYGEEVSS